MERIHMAKLAASLLGDAKSQPLARLVPALARQLSVSAARRSGDLAPGDDIYDRHGNREIVGFGVNGCPVSIYKGNIYSRPL